MPVRFPLRSTASVRPLGPRRAVRAALIATAVLGAGGLALPARAAGADAAEPAAAAAAIAAPSITVTAPVQGVMRDRVIATGLIEPVERVTVQPRIEGQAIEELLADVGDTVAAGQVLARLSDTALGLQRTQVLASRAAADAAIAQAEASLVEAQSAADEAVRVRNRTESLRAQGAGTQAAADQAAAAATSAIARVTVARQALASAQAQLAVTDAQIAEIDLQLSRTEVLAPVAGEVVERNAQIGAIASAAGQAMFVLVRDGALELRADVAEGDLLRIAVGQPVRLRLVGSGDELSGTVRLVEPTIDTATRLGRVRIALEGAPNVRAGQFAEAEIIAAEREGLSLPITAVSTAGAQPTVLRVAGDNTVELVAVVTGIRDAGRVEILEGLAPEDRVVARAGAFVRPGDRINPVPAEAAAATSN